MCLLEKTINAIEEIDYSKERDIQKRLNSLTKPQGSLGMLEEIAKRTVLIRGYADPIIKEKVIFTVAGDHGVVDEGISAFPKEVTPQMVYNFLREGAAINVLAKHAQSRVVVVDIGVACDMEANEKLINKKVNYGTKNIANEPAMTREEAVKALENGIEIFNDEYKKGIDLVGTGEMGIGNTTPSSAITSVITGKSVDAVTGRGTGIGDEYLLIKKNVIKKAISLHNPNSKDGIDVLAKVGGYEIGGLAGIIIGSAAKRVPVVIDGFISGAAALIAHTLEPKVKDFMIASHVSHEQGHAFILDYLGLNPILNLGLRLGEGTGAALAMPIIEASLKILTQMATFDSASVSENNK